MNDMFAQWLIDLQSTMTDFDTEVIQMASHVMDLVANHLQSFVGKLLRHLLANDVMFLVVNLLIQNVLVFFSVI